MKKYSFITALLIFVCFSEAQIVNIPDANFKNALLNNNVVDIDGDEIGDTIADSNNDGEIQTTEAEAVIGLDINGMGIESLEGIESFVNIEYLGCSANNLVSLDITQNNNLKKLKSANNELTNLDISQNESLEVLICPINQLNSMDVTQIPNLKELHIGYNNINSLDVSQNLILEILTMVDNVITSLDVTQNAQLNSLSASGNNLTNLDVSQNPNLEILNIHTNDFSEIDISHNPNLWIFYIGGNQLTSVDLTHNSNLRAVSFWGNQLTEISFSQNPEIANIEITSNLLYNLDLSENPNLLYLTCYDNQLESLNIKNGANTSLAFMEAFDNPNLNCIQVDDPIYANNQFKWMKDATAIYSENCALGIEDLKHSEDIILLPNPVIDIMTFVTKDDITIIKIYTLQGRLIKETKNKQVDVSILSSGLYFASITINGKNKIEKFIKK
jgi:Leucine-rich repeat (LRR) protein